MLEIYGDRSLTFFFFFPVSGPKSEPSNETSNKSVPSTEGKNETKPAEKPSASPSTIQLKVLTDKLVSSNHKDKVPNKTQTPPTQTPPPPPTQRANEKNPVPAAHSEGEDKNQYLAWCVPRVLGFGMNFT